MYGTFASDTIRHTSLHHNLGRSPIYVFFETSPRHIGGVVNRVRCLILNPIQERLRSLDEGVGRV